MSVPSVAVVAGTFNRVMMLQALVSSVRRSVGGLPYRCILVDGGSTDGTLEWLAGQHDCETIEQGELLGAVRAFNAGFGRAVDLGSDYVVVLNDDDELIGPEPEILRCVQVMEADPSIGAVAFETDHRGPWACETVHGRPYCNKGVIRRAAGMAAARAMGDPQGREWWGHDHRTYAADTELGCWIWRLGWRVVPGVGLRVHDNAPEGAGGDALRQANVADYLDPQTGTVALFKSRWGDPRRLEYSKADAVRYGGRVL